MLFVCKQLLAVEKDGFDKLSILDFVAENNATFTIIICRSVKYWLNECPATVNSFDRDSLYRSLMTSA